MSKIKITPLYERLSRDDELQSESNSIIHQRAILTRYAAERGFTNTRILVDDGYTGTNFNRPGVQEGLSLVEQGLVGTWIVKDSCVIIDPNQKDPKMLGLSGLVYPFLTEKRTIKNYCSHTGGTSTVVWRQRG